MPASRRRKAIVARCSVTGEPKSAVARLIGRDNTHGLDDCTDAQLRLRTYLALYLLNASTSRNGTWPREQDRRVWRIWSVLHRLWPYPDMLVVTTSDLAEMRAALVGERPGDGLPGLRHAHSSMSDSELFVHIPSGAMLRLQQEGTRRGTIPPPRVALRDLDLPPLTLHEEHRLHELPVPGPDASRLLAGLLVRLPLADPDGIWTLDNAHLQQTLRRTLEFLPLADRDRLWSPDNAHLQQRLRRTLEFPVGDGVGFTTRLLWGSGSVWHFRWNGPIGAFDVAAALTDEHVGQHGTTAVVRPRRPVQVRHGGATLTLHGGL